MFLDSGTLDQWTLDSGTLDPWTLDQWTLDSGTLGVGLWEDFTFPPLPLARLAIAGLLLLAGLQHAHHLPLALEQSALHLLQRQDDLPCAADPVALQGLTQLSPTIAEMAKKQCGTQHAYILAKVMASHMRRGTHTCMRMGVVHTWLAYWVHCVFTPSPPRVSTEQAQSW